MQRKQKDPTASTVGTQKQPLVIAHRGGSLEAPENTVEALLHAVEVGSDWQEIDVGLSRDHRPVVIHDETLDRTTRGRGQVADYTLAELELLHAGEPRPSSDTLAAMKRAGVPSAPVFSGKFERACVPSLQRVLTETTGRLMIEMKASSEPGLLAKQVIADIHRAGAESRVVLGSFSIDAIAAAQDVAPKLPCMAITDNLDDLPMWQRLTLHAVAVRTDLVAQARAKVPALVPIWAWTCYTVEQARACAQAGADGLITDVPQALVEAMRAEAR